MPFTYTSLDRTAATEARRGMIHLRPVTVRFMDRDLVDDEHVTCTGKTGAISKQSAFNQQGEMLQSQFDLDLIDLTDGPVLNEDIEIKHTADVWTPYRIADIKPGNLGDYWTVTVTIRNPSEDLVTPL